MTSEAELDKYLAAALGGRWLTDAERDAVWRHSVAGAVAGEPRLTRNWPKRHYRGLAMGGVAVALGAAIGYSYVHHKRRPAAAFV